MPKHEFQCFKSSAIETNVGDSIDVLSTEYNSYYKIQEVNLLLVNLNTVNLHVFILRKVTI